jgi:benzoyl-CoA reductase/2-hydroxyglutaryl-CoA dehydratase subunit BcrC/BadD/HgdB
MSQAAVNALDVAFAAGFEALGTAQGPDRETVVISWPSVPVEIIRAAGHRTVLARGSAAPTPAADAVLEAGIFPSRLRQLVEAALTGRLSRVAAIVLPRTSDVDYKCFLYLREFARRGMGAALPPVLLFDLLQSRGAPVREYNRQRVRELLGQLAKLSARHRTAEAVGVEIERANLARQAARRLMALRANGPRLRGTESLALLGAFWQLPATDYTAFANNAADAFAAHMPLPGRRVLLAGAPVDSPALHAAIESEGDVVVEEISPFGSDIASPDVATDADPFAALADWYARYITTARMPAAAIIDRVGQSLTGIDAVVVSLPPCDVTFGWDYPRLRAVLARRGVPHVVIAADPAAPLPAQELRNLQSLLRSAGQVVELRHG